MGIGRLTRNPEIKKVTVRGEETSVCNFSIAVGENKDDASFFEVVCWGKIAENVAKYCFRGNRVCVSGRLKQDRWEKDGNKREKVRINNAMVQFLTPKPKEGEAKTEPPHTGNDAPGDSGSGWDD